MQLTTCFGNLILSLYNSFPRSRHSSINTMASHPYPEYSLPSVWKEVIFGISKFTAQDASSSFSARFPGFPIAHDAGYCKISYKALANAINGTRHSTTGDICDTQIRILTYTYKNYQRPNFGRVFC